MKDSSNKFLKHALNTISIILILSAPTLAAGKEYKITINPSQKIQLPDAKYPKITNFTFFGTGDNIEENSGIIDDNIFKLSYDNIGRGAGGENATANLSFNDKVSITGITISGSCDMRKASGSSSSSGAETHQIKSSNAEFNQSYYNIPSGWSTSYTARSFLFEGQEQTQSGVYPLTSSYKRTDSLNRAFNFIDTPIIVNKDETLTIYVKNRYYTHSTGEGYGCHKTFEFTFKENW